RFFNFANPVWDTPLNLQLNPDVSIREVGVMEKCTFCVQRINAGKTLAKAEKREVRDGEIQPACAQACPTTAIVFGDLNDPESAVSRLSRSTRGTKLLEDVGAKPKITYLLRRSEEHTSELQSRSDLVCRLLLEKKKKHTVEIANIPNGAMTSSYTSVTTQQRHNKTHIR